MYTNLQHHQIKINYICKMKLTIFLLSVVIVCFAAMCYLFHIKPVEPKIIESDSAKVSKALFDSVVTEIGLLKKTDSIRAAITDSLISKKHENKNLIFRNTDMDSLYQQRVRKIEQLRKRQPPY